MKTNKINEGEDIVHRIEREKREREFVKREKKRRKKSGDTSPFFYC